MDWIGVFSTCAGVVWSGASHSIFCPALCGGKLTSATGECIFG